MTWENIAKCLGGGLIALLIYTYNADKNRVDEKLETLEKRIELLDSEKGQIPKKR